MKSLVLPLLLLAGCGGMADSPAACAFTQVATLKLTFEENVPLVDVAVNGVPQQFLLDTGASLTAVSVDTAGRLGLPDDPVLRSFGTAVGGVVAHKNALVDSFKVATLAHGNASLAVIDLPPMLGGKVAGLLGYDILGRYDLDLDLAHSVVTLYAPRNCPSRPTNWTVPAEPLPRSPLGRSLADTVVLVELDGVTHHALLDTGASTWTLSREAAAATGVTDAMLAADRQGTTQGAVKATTRVAAHRFASLKVGSEVIRGPLLTVAIQPRAFGDAKFAMLLGNAYLRRHKVWMSSESFTIHAARATP